MWRIWSWFIFYRMKHQVIRIWLAMVMLTAVIVIVFIHKKNMRRHVRKSTFNTTSEGMMKLLQSQTHEDNNDREPSTQNEAILTLFTTFKNSYSKSYIHKNTIRNWGLMSPNIIPVLFADMNASTSVVDYARQRKWHIFPIPKKSKGGIPILRHMFLEAQKLFETAFYGYANGDILFDKGLTDTLHGLIRLKKNLTDILIVGKRKNWGIKRQQNVAVLEEIGKYAKSSQLFMACAQDYFISTRDGYPWSTIPDFVVGRVGYDNWLVVTALTRRIPLVDATRTITALHQTDAGGVLEGSTATVESMLNKQLIGGNFSYDLAYTFCAHFRTSKHNGSIIVTGQSNGKKCHNQNVPYISSPFHLS